VATQGRSDYDQWITEYELSHSLNAQIWMSYQEENGKAKVFPGNVDRNTVVTHLLTNYPYVRHVRIIAKAWFRHVSLRAELYGC
ncbi:predicted protein, partial [Nematostella vectensis]